MKGCNTFVEISMMDFSNSMRCWMDAWSCAATSCRVVSCAATRFLRVLCSFFSFSKLFFMFRFCAWRKISYIILPLFLLTVSLTSFFFSSSPLTHYRTLNSSSSCVKRGPRSGTGGVTYLTASVFHRSSEIAAYVCPALVFSQWITMQTILATMLIHR